MLKKIILFVLLYPFIQSHGQTLRKYSNEFMNIGVDASSLGMANAVTASTGDVNSGYWNPAGLTQLEDQQVALMHANYFANIASYDYIAYATTIDEESAWGVSLIRFGVDNILNTTELIDSQGSIDYNRIKLFSTADYGVTFSYARRLQIPELQYGINTKIIRRVVGDFASSWGFGFDIGVQYAKNDWNFGLMLRDITTTYNVWNINQAAYQKIADAIPGQNQELPETTEITSPKATVGLSKKFIMHYEYSLLAAASVQIDFVQTNAVFSTQYASAAPAIGVDFGYNDLVFVRAGVGNFQKIQQLDNTTKLGFMPNIGLGFQYKGIQIDYALTNLGNQSAGLYSNIFSVKVDLGLFRN